MNEELLGRIITPESERLSTTPTNLWIYSKEFGETNSVVNPKREEDANIVTKEYEVDVPEEILAVCRYVEAMGGKALLVGGCIRDTVINKEHPDLNLTPKDFDLEVYGIPSNTLHLILERRFGKDLDLTGKKFSIYKVNTGDSDVDLSVPRRDSKVSEGSKGFVVTGDPSMTIPEAALRRDLTINSMAYDPLTKKLYDPYGGVEDIKNRIIRATDVEHFTEDPVRVLRVVQFLARFNFDADDTTTNLCRTMIERGDLDHEPWERITVELQKLLTKGIKPSKGFNFARQAGIVERYWPELNDLIGVPQDDKHHPEGDVWTHELQTLDSAAEIARREGLNTENTLVLMSTMLGHDKGKAYKTASSLKTKRITSYGHEAASVDPARKLFENYYFRMPNSVVKRVLTLIPEHMHPKNLWMNAQEGKNMNKAVASLAERLSKGGETIYMLSLVCEADQRGRNGDKNIPLQRHEVPDLNEWQSWLINTASEINALNGKTPPILEGTDVLSTLNLDKGGVFVGAILEVMYRLQMGGKFSNRDIGVELLSNVSASLLEQSGGIKNDAFWVGVKKNPDKFIANIS